MIDIWDLPLWATTGLILLALAAARAALSTARTPQGAAAWVVFLLAYPLFAVPIFALFGGLSRINQRPDKRHGATDDREDAPGRLHALRAITHVPLREGNDLRLLVDGQATFDAMFAAIDAAETEILVQFYIIRADGTGEALRDRLIAASRRGVRVRVLCDLIGSVTLGWRYPRELREAGVEVRGMLAPHHTMGRVGVNFRNHRKNVVIDNKVGFTGGINIGDEYVDGGKHFDTWRDTHLRVEGPMVGHLRKLFAGDWEVVSGQSLPEMPVPGPAGDRLGLVTGFGPTDPLERGSLLFCGLIGLARRRLWITTPYLVPHADVLTAIQLAHMRGVEVRIMIPYPADRWLAWYASRGIARELVRMGIEVHEYVPGLMHQKVMLIDDDIASVGTVNLDIRSLLLNFEATALVEDKGFASEVETMLNADFDRSRPVPDPPPRHVRLLAPVARLFGPLL
ncbi:putative cardiolipin synthase YwiE [Jannaschia seosinensis]|uniref:Cardiolipin synthase n=1 Tax=Jannaschia seosinensis TaxID=313367 RepID=A0A0M7BDE4_9RHOB|nr:cardiolipin synthase [Jannaschia seosinensis]CUH39913.1 putative cardiolipin synthase YwiE [Jannaschia seosinensis]